MSEYPTLPAWSRPYATLITWSLPDQMFELQSRRMARTNAAIVIVGTGRVTRWQERSGRTTLARRTGGSEQGNAGEQPLPPYFCGIGLTQHPCGACSLF